MDRLIGIHGVNDPTILEAMVNEYGAAVYRLALSILHDPDDAKDVAQDTFLQANAALSRYQVGTNFKAWLLKIAVNNCRMVLRKRSTHRSLLQAWDALTRLTHHPQAIETQVLQAETRSELWNLVDGLDEKYRLVVLLRLAHELTVSEISQVLGVNEKTIYTRLYNALAQLRLQIQHSQKLAHWEDEVQP